MNRCAAAVLVLACVAPLARAGTPEPSLTVGDHVFHRWVLDNGLRVAAVADTGDHASVFVVINAGKRQETPETSGLAHLTEHGLYTGTARTPAGEHDRVIKEDLGGQSNAFTREDYTLLYDHLIPADRLDDVLGMEADRLRNLAWDKDAFAKEQESLTREEERTWQPDDVLDERLEAAVYRVHGYRAGELDAKGHPHGPELTMEQVRAFYDLYYRPDNAAVVVVGPMDPEAALRAVERAFGGLERGPARPPVPQEPEVTEPRTVALDSDLARDRVEFVWIVPGRAHPDLPALSVLARLLGRRTAWDGSPISTELNDRVDPELFRIAATGDDAAQELDALMTRVREELLPADDVEEVKTLMQDDFDGLPLRARPYFSLAATFGEYEAAGEAELLPDHAHAIAAVTPEDLRRVARNELDPARQVTVRFKASGAGEQPLPDDPKLLSDAAQQAEASGDLPRAIAAYTKLLEETHPNQMYTVIYLASRGQIHMERKDYDSAIADFEVALGLVDYPAVRELLDEAKSLQAQQSGEGNH